MLNNNTLRYLEGAVFIMPWMVGFLLFLAFPLGFSFYMSFHHVRILPTRIETSFVGWDYYREIILHSTVLHDDLIPFLQEIVIMVPIIIIFALLIAILLNQQFPGRFLFRAIFFVPVIFTTGYVVMEFVNQGQGSAGFIERYDVSSYLQSILGNSVWATTIKNVLNRFVLILWYSGVQILIFLAGRQTIPKSAYEAARIDGASPWEVFWKITLPAMVPYIMLNLIYTIVDMFTFPFNPVIEVMLINRANYGYNSALAWVYFLIILVFLLICMISFSKMVKRKPAAS